MGGGAHTRWLLLRSPRQETNRALGAGPRKQNAWAPVSLICVTLSKFSTQPQASTSLALKKGSCNKSE